MSTTSMQNIFLTGGSGRLGKELLLQLKKINPTINICSPSHQEFDITNVSSKLSQSYWNQYDAIINTAAYVGIPICEANPDKAFKINATSLKWLVSIPEHIPVFHISTDYVYDGHTLASKETDLLNPNTVYGKSKATGDTHLLAYSKSNMHIIRTSFTPKIWLYDMAFEDVYTNADTCDIISMMIAEFILFNPVAGVYNIGTKRKSYYELAIQSRPNVKKEKLINTDFRFLIRPENSMNITKYLALRV